MENTIIKNLAPLIGTKQNNIRWCPSVASQVCKNLRFASLVCLDIDNDRYKRDGVKFKFENKISIKTYDIYTKVLDLSSEILDTSYVITNVVNDNMGLSINDALFLYSLQKKLTDSAIYDALISSKKIVRSKFFRYVLFIILDAFSLRHSLYEYYNLDKDFIYGELGSERINRLINNVYYVKDQLETFSYQDAVDINHHLTTLFYNLLRLKYDMKKEFIEVDRR